MGPTNGGGDLRELLLFPQIRATHPRRPLRRLHTTTRLIGTAAIFLLPREWALLEQLCSTGDCGSLHITYDKRTNRSIWESRTQSVV